MKLTDKCKEAFENWFNEDATLAGNSESLEWDLIPYSMQYGVYVDFFDSVGIIIDVTPNSYEATRIGDGFEWWISKESGSVNDFTPRTRSEARTQAINKANEIYNLKN